MDLKERFNNLKEKKQSLSNELTKVTTEYNISKKSYDEYMLKLKELGYDSLEDAKKAQKELQDKLESLVAEAESIFSEED